MLSPFKIKTVVIAPMISGSISLAASSTLVAIILRHSRQTGVKQMRPVRRVFFGLCIYDRTYSFGQAMSALPTPQEPDGFFGSIGNMHSCRFQA